MNGPNVLTLIGMNTRRCLSPLPQWPARFGKLRPLLLFLGLFTSNFCLGQATVLWKEGFETDDLWDRWHVEGGVWAVGAPTSGPNQALAGTRCAGTVLDGNYPANADARLVRDWPPFTVPSASDRPQLRFWHWYRGGSGATRSVEIKVGTAPWQAIEASSGWVSDSWSRATFDLSPFSGQVVQIAFHFKSSNSLEVAAGWYIDEVAVETGSAGSVLIDSPEGFEGGLGTWTVSQGNWEVGVPTRGPRTAHGGTNCAAATLSRDYYPSVDSRLVSPEVVVPLATDNPRLRFWHWFSTWPTDYGQVEITVDGGTWQPLSGHFAKNSSVWTRPSFDLRPYAGQTVQLAFHFRSDSDTNVGPGWYIDDVVIETGAIDWDPVTAPEDFEQGLGDWVVDNGTWEVGHPVFGATEAASGLKCAGTVLAGNYIGSVDSRLISPEFTVPGATNRPRLRFWQWLRNLPGDPATVEIRVVGSDWAALSPPTTANDGTWAQPYFALDAFAGQRVQIAFHFQSNNDGQVAPGWLIDNVRVETGPIQNNFINQPQSFEGGLGDWSVDHGTWEVGTPVDFPDTAHTGTNCVGTVMVGNYSPGVDSRLISPEFIVPSLADNPRLRFWQWSSSWPTDFGTVEVSVSGGPWESLPGPNSGNSPVWTRAARDLRPFAGQSVRVAFRFQSDSDFNIARGWYIDDVVVETGPTSFGMPNTPESFEAGIGDWSVDYGTWEVGRPSWGPGPAFKGTNCAATVLQFSDGRYFPNTDSRLISPEFTVPCSDAGPRLRFTQWYDIASGDQGTVEVREAGGTWQEVLGAVSGSSGGWVAAAADLAAYAGKRIQVGFRFRSNDDAVVGTGWYLDEIKIQATVLQSPQPTAVQEGKLLTYTFSSPCQAMRFSLGPNTPPGVSIDPELGLLVWVPTEEQGPGVYPIQVCLTAIDQPSAPVDCVILPVTVLELNTPPSLAPIDGQPIAAGALLQLTVTAFDADLPAQNLTFSLANAPGGASIDPVTGVFSWIPTPTQATDQHTITVQVTDDGTPPLSASTSFTATPQGPLTAIYLSITRLQADWLSISVEGGILGAFYTIESTSELNPSSSSNKWTEVDSFWKGAPNFQETVHSTNNVVQFYRVRGP